MKVSAYEKVNPVRAGLNICFGHDHIPITYNGAWYLEGT